MTTTTTTTTTFRFVFDAAEIALCVQALWRSAEFTREEAPEDATRLEAVAAIFHRATHRAAPDVVLTYDHVKALDFALLGLQGDLEELLGWTCAEPIRTRLAAIHEKIDAPFV